MNLKLHAFFLAGVLSAVSSFAQTFPVNSIVKNGEDTNRINLVYLPDGFQSAQLPKFNSNVNSIQDYVFTAVPFKQYSRFFNVYTIDVPSVDSGVTHPGTATDVTEPAFPVASVSTFFNSSFDLGGVHRAVFAQDGSAVFSVLADNFPMYDVPMVLVNTPEYGGTGGSYITFTINVSANETAVHELGHTFGKLWDEYWNGMPGEHPNMTQDTAASTVAWKNWMKTQGIGVYAYGNTPPESDWFRPHQNCKMQFLGAPLCAVCKENIIDRIYDKVNPIDAFSPNNTNAIWPTGTPLTFNFTPVLPQPNTIKYKWMLNGTVINTTDTFVQITQSQLAAGTNTLTAVLTDTTLMSRSNLPANGYMFSKEWKIQNGFPSTVSSVNGSNKFVYKLYPVPAKNTVNLLCNNVTNANSVNYEITSITGSIVKKGTLALTLGEQRLPIDISGIAAGNYTLSLNGEGISVNSLFVVE